MKTIPIPHRKKSVAGSFKTIAPPAPHVNLTIKHKLNATAKKTKILPKRIIVTKIKNGDNIRIDNAETLTKNKTTRASAAINTPVDSVNQKKTRKKTIASPTYISWPRQVKRKKIYDETNSPNNTPFDLDELTTLDKFESLAKANGIESLSHYAGVKQLKTRRPTVKRRKNIDPTTCERNYSIEEVEFMNAVSEYKRASGRMFPTCSEILEVLKNLGYEKLK
jgi:hypothetical protein